MKAAIEKPSLWDSVVAYMHRAGIEVPAEVLERDTHEPWVLSEELAQALGAIYRNLDERYSLYTILESLLDLDQKLLLWRYRHVSMVERIIGITRGTGGTHGVEYLSRTLSKRAFPEIWEARQHIITKLESTTGMVLASEEPLVSILFCDIVDFHKIVAELSAVELVTLLDRTWSKFDLLCEKHGVTKMETVGDPLHSLLDQVACSRFDVVGPRFDGGAACPGQGTVVNLAPLVLC